MAQLDLSPKGISTRAATAQAAATAGSNAFAPGTPGSWTVAPATYDAGLDELADRVVSVEATAPGAISGVAAAEGGNAIVVTFALIDGAAAALADTTVFLELFDETMEPATAANLAFDVGVGTPVSLDQAGSNIRMAVTSDGGAVVVTVTDKVGNLVGSVWLRAFCPLAASEEWVECTFA